MKVYSHRRTLLPYLAKKLKARKYLEIGVKGGKTFLPIKVWKKIAVDPDFRIKADYRRSQIFKWLPNLWAQYHAMTSDDFFRDQAADVLKPASLDLAFIDGLHTYEQTYIDLINTLPYVKENGVILLHDCSPKSTSAAYPAESIDAAKAMNLPGWNGMWSGDVWKVIPRIQMGHPELQVKVIDEDSGLGLVIKKPSQSELTADYDAAQIDAWDYAHLDANRTELLNLCEAKDVDHWLSKHLQW
ncbi:class I SAM-dependent methyltransferase [Marinicella sp. W31]|uniref:class I SAM-dependent methyltransferase n=1 Tax=Marinicella sp. W31 TaxID=3023713 RepID=UPI003756C0AF